MQVPPPEASILELRQTRAFSRTERTHLVQMWRKLMWPNGGGALYNTSYYLWYGFGSFLLVSVWMAVDRLSFFDSDLSVQLALAAIGFAAALALSHWVNARMQHDLYWRQLSSHDRYVIDENGIRHIGATGEVAHGWRAIEHLVCADPYVVLLCGGQAIMLAKAAFADQDVDGFCAELERRWRATRSAP